MVLSTAATIEESERARPFRQLQPAASPLTIPSHTRLPGAAMRPLLLLFLGISIPIIIPIALFA